MEFAAGFIHLIGGDRRTMSGLSRSPVAEQVDIDGNGNGNVGGFY